MEPVIIKPIRDSITIVYSGKLLGNTQTSFSPDANANFSKFKSMFPGKTVYDMPAVGKDAIVNVDTLTPEKLDEMEADALITKDPSALLVLKPADCIPLVFYVKGKDILALVHAGVSGASLHLPSKTIKEMGYPANQTSCFVGPHIGQRSYRFTDRQKFDEKKLDAGWKRYISEESDGIHIDLLGYVLGELKNIGVLETNIDIEDVDTGADSNYFSHRRHKLTGEPDGRNCLGVCLIRP